MFAFYTQIVCLFYDVCIKLRGYVTSIDVIFPAVASFYFMGQTPSWDADSQSSGEKIPSLYRTRRFITVFTKSRHWTLPSQLNPIHAVKHCLFKFVLILSLHVHPGQDVVHVDGARLCLWTATTNGNIVQPPHVILEWRTMVEWYWHGKLQYSEQTLSQCHFIHHKSHLDCPGRQPGPPRWEAGG
jgi:hypothetical protein